MPADGFILIADHGEQVAYLKAATEGAQGLCETSSQLESELKKEKVVAGIDPEAIDKAFEKLDEGIEPGELFEIAHGTSVVHGEPGRIEFTVDVSGEARYEGISDDSSDSIDFKEAVVILSVKKGEVIAKVLNPVGGKPGLTLAGKEIQPKTPKEAKYKLGEGVEENTETREIVATREGRPIHKAGVVAVEPVLELPGDIDLSTGNIEFDGTVLVHGGILDGFGVEAKELEVDGVVGAANIKISGPCTFKGGVQGKERADIVVQGELHAKYVNGAKIECRGDILVTREIVNTTIWCRGKVTAGKIIGGECLAMGGIEAVAVGSEMGVATILEPGANYIVRRIENAMDVFAEHIEGVIRPVRNFFGDRPRFLGLPGEKRKTFHEALDNFMRLKAAYLKLIAARDNVLGGDHREPEYTVLVRKIVWPDVQVRTESCMRQFRTEITGPVALVEDLDRYTIRATAYNPETGAIADEDEEEESGPATLDSVMAEASDVLDRADDSGSRKSVASGFYDNPFSRKK